MSSPPSSNAGVGHLGDDTKPQVVKGKKTARKPVRRNRKKPKDMPQRALSAYNFYFKEQRNVIMAEREKKKAVADGSEPKAESLFTILAKTIATRWKTLAAQEKVKYERLADEDMKRYRREMDEYHQRIAERSRLEAESEANRQEEMRATMAANPNGFPGQEMYFPFFARQQQASQQPVYGGQMPDPNVFAQQIQQYMMQAQQQGHFMNPSALQPQGGPQDRPGPLGEPLSPELQLLLLQQNRMGGPAPPNADK